MRALNAYLETPSTILAAYRDAEGVLRGKRVAAEYVSFHQRDEVERADEMLRELRASQYVRSLRVEGEWIRIAWHDAGIRRAYCTEDASPLARAGIQSFEADVSPERRWMTDEGVEIARPRRCYLDIETDSRVPFSRKTEMRVLCWAVVDGEDRSIVHKGVLEVDTDDAERELLLGLWNALRPYDQVCAWNGGNTRRKEDGFDFPVIFARTRMRGIVVDARRWLWLDHLAAYRRLNTASKSGDEKQSMKLEDVGQQITKRGKLRTPEWVIERFGERTAGGLGAFTWQLWEAGGRFRDLLVEYNVQDTQLLFDVEKKTGFVELFQTLCEACHVFGDTQGLNPTVQVDAFMLRLGLARGHHFPTREYREQVDKFKGAFVLPTKQTGIIRNVHVCDFKSLYPSIILTWNMSPDTRVPANVNGPIQEGHARAPTTGVTFRTDVEGLLPMALRELIRLRQEWSKRKSDLPAGTPEWDDANRRSTAYKVAANSFYGVIGSIFSRYFDRAVAESITQTGVWLIKRTLREAEERGMTAIYGDTDSSFVVGVDRFTFDEFITWCNGDLYPGLVTAQGCKENAIKLSYEKEFDRLLLTNVKKRYAGSYRHFEWTTTCVCVKRIDPDTGRPVPGAFDVRKMKCRDCGIELQELPPAIGEPEVKGFEYKRSDASKLARLLQANVIDLIIGGLHIAKDGPVPTEDVERVHTLLAKVRDYVLNSETLPLQQVKISKGLSKELGEYASRKKNDGTETDNAHIAVAKIMAARGQDVAEGTRIEYVVVDGSVSPAKVIPAEDYVGECDRHYVWEQQVYPVVQRLLTFAFPAQDWESWARTRPPKPRGGRKPLPGQLAFDLGAELVKPRFVVDGAARVNKALGR